MKKKLYIVDYWVPFPSSEYGGIYVVIAKDDKECIRLLSRDEQWNNKYHNLIPEAVRNARKYSVANNLKSEIVEEFTT